MRKKRRWTLSTLLTEISRFQRFERARVRGEIVRRALVTTSRAIPDYVRDSLSLC